MSATLIDNKYSNLIFKDTLSVIILTDVAHYFGTFHIVTDLNRRTDKLPFNIKRKFTPTNITKFKQLLCDRNLFETLNTDCPDSTDYKSISAFPLLKMRFEI